MKSCRLFNFLGKMISKSIRKSLICSTFSASTGRFFSALCWGIQGCRFLAAKVWSRAFARKHQPAAPAAVWAARSPRLYYQEYRYVLTTVSKRSRVNSFITVENIYCAHCRACSATLVRIGFIWIWIFFVSQTGEMTTGCWSTTVPWTLLETGWETHTRKLKCKYI